MRHRSLLPPLSVVVALGLLLAACGGDGPETDEAAADGDAAELQEVTLLLPFPHGAGWPDLVAAQDVGYFEDEGLVVNTEAAEGSEFVAQQIVSDNVTYGSATVTSIIVGAAEDPRLKVVHCNQARSPYKIVVLEDSPIQSIEDFEGETLGVSAVSGGERPIVDAALRDAGLEPNTDVQLLPIGDAGPQSLQAIEDGTVAGHASAVSDLGPLESMGLDFRDLTPQKYMEIQGACFFVTQDTLSDPAKREVVEGIARGWSKGALFTATNPEAVLEMVCERFAESCQDEAFAESNHAMRIEQATPPDPDAPFGTVTPDSWGTAVDLLVDAGVIDEPLDVEALVASEELQAVQDAWSDYDPQEVIAEAESWGQ